MGVHYDQLISTDVNKFEIAIRKKCRNALRNTRNQSNHMNFFKEFRLNT